MAEFNYSNKKSLESQKKIYKGLRVLLQTKALNEITVTDISTECNISRATFYRNFDNVMDILEITFDFYYKRYIDFKKDNEDQLLYFLNYWVRHKDLVSILTNQAPTVISSYMSTHYKESLTPEEIKIKVDLFSRIITNLAKNKLSTTTSQYNLIIKILTDYSINLLLK